MVHCAQVPARVRLPAHARVDSAVWRDRVAAGAILGDNLGFTVGRYGGYLLLARVARLLHVNNLASLEAVVRALGMGGAIMVVVCFSGIFGAWLARRRRERELLEAQARDLVAEPATQSPAARVLEGTAQRSGDLLVEMAAERADEPTRDAAPSQGQPEPPR